MVMRVEGSNLIIDIAVMNRRGTGLTTVQGKQK